VAEENEEMRMIRFQVKYARFAALALVAFGVATPVSANVSIRNGNFFIGYTDVLYPGGYEPKIERVYNSKSPFNGIFGWGWGSDYEAYLTVEADGSVLVSESGGGAENRFSPTTFNAKELDAAVATIAEAARKAGAIGSGAQLENYKKQLKGNADFRNEEWAKWKAQGKVAARKLAVGTKLVSNRFAYQWITATANGYVRASDTGKVETFDPNGRLLKVQDKNGNFIALSYNKVGKVEKIQDNLNRKMYLTYNRLGKVEKIQTEGNKTCEYKYNDLGELTYSKDSDGNAYTYKYSSDKRHNLTEIGYSDRTSMKIGYYGRDQLENVKSVKDRDGSLTEYAYDKVAGEKNSLKVGVNVKSGEGRTVSTSLYEYVFRNKANGEEWTYKMVSTLDGLRTETVYNECCGLPIFIKRANEETTFAYDTKGRVTKKVTPNEVTELAYDQKVGKVNRVVKYPKANKKKTEWSTFQYDPRGNLLAAKNSAGAGVRLFYDNLGRIKSMVDQKKKQIHFKYNENSKPVEISDPSMGTITVAYANNGEVRKVDSTGGRKIALAVTSAFQNLLEIIRPAGVTLSF
jgi:YD repeat-containing protein